ncbi:MAG: hypothetical protein JSV56_00020 [Methanomassiliicoccales archaeon]|nr:MAG: hypothetical protein JSV56_00020 [Methanomassiliicoccales archaeon]
MVIFERAKEMKKRMLTSLVRVLAVMMVVGLMSGCAGLQPAVKRVPFPAEEYAKLPEMGTGTATVRGQAFLKTMVGEVKYAAGNEVVLAPVTSYSTQMYETSGNWAIDSWRPYPQYEPRQPDPRRKKYGGYTQGDGEGRFEFKKVPEGEYYLGTYVQWSIPQQYGYRPQGGTITKKITVEEGKEYNMILTR